MKIKSKVLSFTLTLAMLITVFMPSMAASSKQSEKNVNAAHVSKVSQKKFVSRSKSNNKTGKKVKEKNAKSKSKKPSDPRTRAKMVKITFDAGEGSGDMEEEEVEKGSEYELPDCGFDPPNDKKEFSMWEVTIGTKAPKLYGKDDSIKATDNVKCKAIWRNRPVARFDKNGGSTEMKDELCSIDEEYKVSRCSIKPPAGKVFDHWHVEMDGYHKDIKPGETITVLADMNFKPIWEETPFDVYKISYLPGGAGGNMNPEYIAMNSNFVIPEPEFEQEGGTGFRGYNVKVGSNDLGLKRVGDIIRITDDTKLEAVFEDMHMIHIDPNAPDENEETDECLPGDNYVLPKPKFDAPPGKVFDYWEVKTDENAPTGETKQPFDKVKCDSDLFIKAIWKNAPSTKFNIKFDKNGGTGTMESKKVPKDSWFEIPHSEFEAPDRKSFKHWQVTVGNAAPETYEDTSGDWIHVKGDVEFKAIYEDIPVVQYDPNEGTGSIPDEWVEEGNEYTLPSTCKITPPAGMIFDKWQIRMNGFIKDFNPGAKFTVTHDVIVKPLWKVDPAPGKVTVSFDKNGGSGNMNSVEVNKYSEYKLPACTFTAPEGMEFDKWSVKIGDDSAEDKNPGEKVTASDNIKVTAMWRAKPKVNVTFDKNGGSGNMPAKAVVKDSEYTLPVCRFTAPADKEFDKWSVTVTGFPAVDKMPGESIVASDNITVKAMWKEKTPPPAPAPVKVNVMFNGNTGSGSMPVVEVEKGSNYTLPVCSFTAPADKEFDKWSVTVTGSPAVDKMPGESIVASDSITVKAMWKEKTPPPAPAPVKVNVTFNGNTGSGSMPDKEVVKDSEFTLPVCGFTAPADKEFDKWLVTVGAGSGVNKMPGESIVAGGDVSVTAMWKAKTVPPVPPVPVPDKANITFNKNGGNGNMDLIQVEKGSNYTLPVCSFTAPTDKEFDKWSVIIGSATAVDKQPGEGIVASDNVAVTALWKEKAAPPVPPAPDKVKITFKPNGGTQTMPEVDVNRDSEYTLPECGFTAPVGKEFDKWQLEINGFAKFAGPGEAFKVLSKTTVMPIWKDKAVTEVGIKYEANGGSGEMAQEIIAKNAKFTVPACEYKAPAGSAFKHWEVTVGQEDAVNKVPGEKVVAKEDITLKAVWEKQITVSFNNGGEEITGVLPSGIVTSAGKTVYLPLPKFKAKNENKAFAAWEDSNKKQYKPGSAFLAGDDAKFIAVWKDKTPEVEYTTLKFEYEDSSIGMKERKYVLDSKVTMPKFSGKIPEGKGEFSHWKAVNNKEVIERLEAGDSFTIKGDTVATPVFKEVQPPKVTLKLTANTKLLKITKKTKAAKLKFTIRGEGISIQDIKALKGVLTKGKTNITGVSLKTIGKGGVFTINLNKKLIAKIKKKRGALVFTILKGEKTKATSVKIKVVIKKK